jgi:hypothetical protein
MSLLLRWKAEDLSAPDLHEQAEEMWNSQEWGLFNESDDRSIAVEVLSVLDSMNQQWIMIEDIPAIVAFLNTPPSHAAEAWRWWRKYWDGVDFIARKRRLTGNPFYAV